MCTNIRDRLRAFVWKDMCVSNSIAAEEILWLQRQELCRTLSANIKDLLNTLMLLLRKHFSTFTDHPHLVFQTLLNEGGTVVSAMSSNILQHKYREIPYLEFVNKQMQQGAVLARFQCSSFVRCFDVSRQLDLIVCKCDDRRIQLWSRHTGELLWTRPVKVTTQLPDYCEAYRISKSFIKSFYCSVVFHPTEEVILPGVLSHCYDFNGDLKPLFPESQCIFNVCSISGDKTRILTDCPDDGKCIIIWSLKNGLEISRITRDEDVLSFAWSRDGKLLAISHASGRIAIVDVVDGFRTLGQTDLRKICGMIRFSPDSRSLFCLHLSLAAMTNCTFRLNINIAEHLTCRVDVFEEPCVTWEFESHSEDGFLLGDPLLCVFEERFGQIVPSMKFGFVLDKHTVLRMDDDRIEMLNISEQHEDDKVVARNNVVQIVFSLSGEIIYVSSRLDDLTTTLTAWDILTSELIAEKKVDILWSSYNRLLAVKAGVLIIRGTCTLEVWNFDLSKCVRCWTNLGSVTDLIPISEERVACATKEKSVIILDTTSGEFLSTIQINHNTIFLACNSKFQILTWAGDGCFLRLSDRKTTLWEKQVRIKMFGRFSPAETFVISYCDCHIEDSIDVLDADSGNTLHVLSATAYGPWGFFDCKFVSDEECIVTSKSINLQQCRVQLFNVKSGDLLSTLLLGKLPLGHLQLDNRMIFGLNGLAVSPCKDLVAIDQSDTKHGYELIQLRLPGDEDSRKCKWILNPGKHKRVQTGEQEQCPCLQEYYDELQQVLEYL